MIVANTGSHDFEALLVDNSGSPEVADWAEGRRAERVRTLTVAPPEGWAAAANRVLERAAPPTVRVPASLTAPPRDRWNRHMSAVWLTLHTGLRVPGPGGGVR